MSIDFTKNLLYKSILQLSILSLYKVWLHLVVPMLLILFRSSLICEHHNPLPWVLPIKQVPAVYLIHKGKNIHRHQFTDILIWRIIEEQLYLTGIFIVGIFNFCQNFSKNLYWKRIEEKYSVHLCRYNVVLSIPHDEFRPAAWYGMAFVFADCFIYSAIIFHTDGTTSCLVGQKKVHTPFSAPIIQQAITFPYIAAACQSLQHRIRRWLIRVSVLIRTWIIASRSFYFQQFIPLCLIRIYITSPVLS